MLGLTPREQFSDKPLKGVAIELSKDTNASATRVAAKQFLEITYPTPNLLTSPKFVAEKRLGLFLCVIESALQQELQREELRNGDRGCSLRLIRHLKIMMEGAS